MMAGHSQIRVRFAPSPTGHLHIGSFRTALFNWLFARHNKGTFLVRIEDTDLERSKQEYVQSIMGALDWVGMQPDEPVIVQSARSEEYEKVLQQLLESGNAYKCFCSQEQVVERAGDNAFVKYDQNCRSADQKAQGSFVIRFKLPDISEVSFKDLIRGDIAIPIDQLDDFIIARSDGTPTYNFVVVVDDAHSKITHVIRGEDHISNTPKQILLYHALSLPVPSFAHIPLILGPSGDRLSKRDGATSAMEYKGMGYLPDAFINYLVRLGWSHGDQEIFSRKELIDLFTLESVGKKGSIFDIEKLNWVNSVYIKEMSAQVISTYISQELDKSFDQLMKSWNMDVQNQAIDLYKARATTLLDLIKGVTLLHNGPESYDKASLEKWTDSNSAGYISQLIELLESKPTIAIDELKAEFKDLAKKNEVKLVKIAQPARIALIGTSDGPGIFDMIAIVGIPETISRLSRLKEML